MTVDPKLIERIARAMCKADGNDPDNIGQTGHEFVHHGFASSWTRPHQPEKHFHLWMIYRSLAEAAILEMEAAAMEPFPLSPGTSGSDPLPVPVERTPWFPQLQAENGVFLTEKTCRILTASEIEVSWSEKGIYVSVSDGSRGFELTPGFLLEANRDLFDLNMSALGAKDQADEVWKRCQEVVPSGRCKLRGNTATQVIIDDPNEPSDPAGDREKVDQ
jgi:hypothetical protein